MGAMEQPQHPDEQNLPRILAKKARRRGVIWLACPVYSGAAQAQVQVSGGGAGWIIYPSCIGAAGLLTRTVFSGLPGLSGVRLRAWGTGAQARGSGQ